MSDIFQVTLLDRAFAREGAEPAPATAELRLVEPDGTERRITLGHFGQDQIDQQLAKGQLDLAGCLVLDFSLARFRARAGLPSDEHTRLERLRCPGAFFLNQPGIPIDWSRIHLEAERADFHGATFAGAPLRFDHALLQTRETDFEGARFRCALASFADAGLGLGAVSFKNAAFGPGKKDFGRARFAGQEANFANVEFSDGETSFSHAAFAGKANFKIARFGQGKVDFGHCRFGDGGLEFELATFGPGKVNFREASFGKGSRGFDRTRFECQELNFMDCRFADGSLSFVNAQFGDCKLNFKQAQFGDGPIDFHYSDFGHAELNFDRAYFGRGEISFKAIECQSGKISFSRARFGEGRIDFQGIKLRGGRVSFRRSSFERGELDFSGAELEQAEVLFEDLDFAQRGATFETARLGSLAFDRCQFSAFVNLKPSHCGELRLNDCLIRDIIDMRPGGASVQIDRLDLFGTRLLGKLFLDWKANRLEALIHQQDRGHREKAEQFRTLKESFNQTGRYNDEDRAYVAFKRQEQIAQLKEANAARPATRPLNLASYAFKWLVFDKMGEFATNPVRVFASMFAVYVLFSLVYIVLPLLGVQTDIVSSIGDPDKLSLVAKSFYHSAITYLTIGYGDYYPSGVNRTISAFEGFMGIFMMAYFTVAFVRKILR